MGTLRIRLSGNELTFDPGQAIRIGREPDSTITVENPNVSRSHAVVTNENGAWVLRDVGSSQGTWRDSRRVDSVEIHGTVHLTLGREGRGEIIVLETAVEPPGDASRPGGAIGGVDLQASTEIVGNRTPSNDDPSGAGTVIVGNDIPSRPSGAIDDAQLSLETVVTGSEIRLECGGRTYVFTPGQQVRIGRDADCEIVSANPTVSRVHAVFHHDGKGWILSDPGSTSGIFRKGGRIFQAIVIGSSAIWLGEPDVGERVVVATATADKQRTDQPGDESHFNATSSPDAGVVSSRGDRVAEGQVANREPKGQTTGKVLVVVAVSIAVVILLLVIIALVAFIFLARS